MELDDRCIGMLQGRHASDGSSRGDDLWRDPDGFKLNAPIIAAVGW
jgi:hypothetical protein